MQTTIITNPIFIVISTGRSKSIGAPFNMSLKFIKWNGLYGSKLMSEGKIIGKKNKIKWINKVKYIFFKSTFKIIDNSITNSEIINI